VVAAIGPTGRPAPIVISCSTPALRFHMRGHPMKREEAMELASNGFDELSQALAQGKSDALVAYLNVMARFHNYSFRNCLLIAVQRPSATRVAGFRQWPKLGRHVKKGETGIAILAPLVYKRKSDEESTGAATTDEAPNGSAKALRGFKIVHVFDVEQTEGDPLPEFEKVSGEPGDWLDKLEHVVRDAGIELAYEDYLGGAEGLSQGGKVSVLSHLPPAEKFFVLVHEYGHELLHRGERRKETSKKVRETQAEAVGFVVSHAIGLDARTHASDYIQLYSGDTETLQESMQFIQQTAARIVEQLHAVDADATEASVVEQTEVQHVA